jgi:hypothetical protein
MLAPIANIFNYFTRIKIFARAREHLINKTDKNAINVRDSQLFFNSNARTSDSIQCNFFISHFTFNLISSLFKHFPCKVLKARK